MQSYVCLKLKEAYLERGETVDRLSSQSPLITKPVSLVVRRPEKLST